MKTLLTLLLASVTALAQSPERAQLIPVTDLTSSANVVSFTGTIDSREQINGSSITRKEKGSVTIKNVSAKTIVGLMASFRCLAFRGPEEPILYKHDFFFKPHAFDPGDIMEFPLDGEETGDSYDPREVPSYIKAELLYVQFDDGSAWGDPEQAIVMFSERKKVEAGFARLKDIYESKGASAFVDTIRVGASGKVGRDPFTSEYRYLKMLLDEQQGPDSVYALINSRVSTSTARRSSGKFEP